MSANPATSLLYGSLFGDAEIARLFSDSVDIRALLLVEGTLAKVQGTLGMIPAEAAVYIERAALEVQIDPAALAAETAQNGVPIPALLAAFRKQSAAPDLMQYLHWGATSQDIMDTALALRLRRVLDLWDARLKSVIGQLGQLAQVHADLPMAARTYGQIATPTSFGAVVAGWGWPLQSAQGRLSALRPEVLRVSLSGAAGTLSAMGPQGAQVRAELARALDLADPGHSWHADRSGIGSLAGFAAGLAASLGKLGEDLTLLSQSGIAEVRLEQGGASSTMPQKQNPVGPSTLVALSRVVIGQAAILQGAGLHRQQRDGAAWFTEWLTLPQLCVALGRILTLAGECLHNLTPDADAMTRQMETDQGSIHAEALSFSLCAEMPRPEAQQVVKDMVQEAISTATSLASVTARRYPQIDWASLAAASLGQAPAEARAFAARVRG